MNSQTKIIEIIIEIMSDVLNISDVNVTTTRQNTPEWNSLKHMEIVFAIEEEFEIQYTVEEIIGLASVLDISQSIMRKQS